jgi:hypothetical protein
MHIRSPFRLRLAALAVVPALTLAMSACSDGGSERADVETLESDADDETSATDAADTTVEPATTEAAATTDSPVDTAAPVTVPEVSVAAVTSTSSASQPAEPLAVVRGPQPWKQLRILDLRRDGDHVTLDFEIVVGEGDTDARSVHEAFCEPCGVGSGITVDGVTLIDHANRKRHLVLRDEEGVCVCTEFVDPWPEENTTHPHSAQFPAPPANVRRMTVAVPKFPIVDNVPLREDS